MGLDFEIIPYVLKFKFDAKTSRGSLSEHKTWIVKGWDQEKPGVIGYGECAPFEGLSIDDIEDFSHRLFKELKGIEGANAPSSLEKIDTYVARIDPALPAVRFGLETCLRDLYYDGNQKIFDSNFFNQQKAIEINGLVWMGSKEEMMERLELKILTGFECIKLKIGALSLAEELEILRDARNMIGNDGLCMRLDANGAYSADEVKGILKKFAAYNIHSIEQPIKSGQIKAMKDLCADSPVPIALDEELIGVHLLEDKRKLLSYIQPQYIVLKPTLLGGFRATSEWIALAEDLGIGWWITSALESNIGLNAICQFVSQYDLSLPQGLGTGELYVNNIPSPLSMENGCIYWDPAKNWYMNLTERHL